MARTKINNKQISFATDLVPDSADGIALGSASAEFSDLYLADGAVISLGADQDVTLTHVADTGILLNGAMKLQFRDSAIHLSSDADGYLNAQADTGVNINIGGTDELAITSSSATFGGNLVIPDAGTIGSASDADAIAISAAGVVTLSATTEASAIGTAALVVTGGASVAKDLYVGDDLELDSDGAKLGFGADSDVSLTHVADTGLLLNGAMKLQFRDSAIHLSSDADGYLNAQADTGVNINIGGTDELAITSSTATFGTNLVIPDAGTIGSASDADAMAISAGGVVSFSATTEASAVGTAAVTVAGGLGVAKDMWLGDDLVLDSDAAAISFGADQDVSLTHVADTGLLLNGSMQLQFRDATESIGSDADGYVDIDAATAIHFNAAVSGSGAAQFGGNVTIAGALLPDAAGDSDLGSASAEWGHVYIADDKKLQFGSDQDFTIEYDEDGQDVAQFAGSNMRIGHGAATELQFRDSALKIYSSADGQLDIDADSEVEITATTVDINGAVDVSGALTVGGNLTVNGTTTTVNSSVVTIDDPIFTLGGDTAPSTLDTKDRGVEMRYFQLNYTGGGSSISSTSDSSNDLTTSVYSIVFSGGADISDVAVSDKITITQSSNEWTATVASVSGQTVGVSSAAGDTITNGNLGAASVSIGSAKVAFMGWDSSAGGFQLFSAATNSSETFSGTNANMVMGNLKSSQLILSGGADQPVTSIKDEDNMASNSATALATQQSIKAYVDAQDLDCTTDSGTIDVALGSETLSIVGGEGIDTSASGTTVTVTAEEATAANKGVASYSSTGGLDVSSGVVSLAGWVTLRKAKSDFDASSKDVTITGGTPLADDAVMVFHNGQLLDSSDSSNDDCAVSGTTLTLSDGLYSDMDSGDVITIMFLKQ